jgi:hypothetical protein
MMEQLGSGRGAAFKWRWAIPLVPIAASMFCLSALVYYHTAMGGTGQAWGFLQGAVVFLYRWLGFVPTFMFWLLLFVWCSIWFVTGRWDAARTRLLWLGAFTLSIAILVNLGVASEPPPHAGLIGSYVAVRLTSVIGYAFGALLAVAAALASLLLATDFLFYRYFEALARGRAAEEAGVEPEATDAFRELAFGGVYAEPPRAAEPMPEVNAGAAATAVAASPAEDEVLAQDLGRAVENDVIVRPRRRRRGAEHAASPGPEHGAEFGIVVPPADEVADSALADPAAPAHAEREPASEEPELAAVGAFDGAFPVGLAPPRAEDEFEVVAEGVAESRQALDDDTEARAADDEVAHEEAMVEIPRAPARQGRLFAPSAASGDDLDRAAREVLGAGRASVNLLRRQMRCSSSEAIAMLDGLRAAGVIDGEPGTPNGRVLTTLADWEAR